MTDLTLWRAFPWDPAAREEAPFSPSFAPRPTGRGRFDLPLGASPTLYVAESPEHAIGEMIQPWRGRAIGQPHLDRVASRHRSVTQPIARAVWDAGYAGLRWWSSFWGDWHTVVLFPARLTRPVRLDFGKPTRRKPTRLTLETPALLDAARLLGIEIRS